MKCEVAICSNDSKAKGLCMFHYGRRRDGVPLNRPVRVRHHMSNSSEHSSYQAMRNRCYNEKHKYYKNYGGRNIKVCDRWLESFNNFLEDMGRKPDASYTIDRINNSKGYEPSNCRWATRTEQARNRGVTSNVEKTKSERLAAMIRAGIDKETIQYALNIDL